MLDGGFWIGLCNVSHVKYFDRAFVSANVIRGRRSGFAARRWIMDSGAFTEVTTYGGYRTEPEEYAYEVRKWGLTRTLVAAVSQDYMCESFVLEKTGLTVPEHQRLTIERYDRIRRELDRLRCAVPLVPVLQGYEPEEYADHLRAYDGRLTKGMWVGVGSVCKRNADPDAVFEVLDVVKSVRPDLCLHGFGLKTTALADAGVVGLLHSADSMAWSDAARRTALPLLLSLRKEFGRYVPPAEAREVYRSRGVFMPDANGINEARTFYEKVNRIVGGRT